MGRQKINDESWVGQRLICREWTRKEIERLIRTTVLVKDNRPKVQEDKNEKEKELRWEISVRLSRDKTFSDYC